MDTTELELGGLLGLAVAWETLVAALGALLVGLAVGIFFCLRVAAELARTSDVEGVARALLDEIGSLFGVDFAALSFVSEDGSEASGYLARSHGSDVDWWRDVRVDLVREPSGIASAVREVAGFAVDHVEDTRVSPRLAARTGAKSAAYIPLVSAERAIAVISVATTEEERSFSADELTLMQTLASEATVAFERTRSTLALAEALDRERLILSIGRRLRTELDLGDALQAAVADAGRALGPCRCFVRVGESGGREIVAACVASGAAGVAQDGEGLPVSDLVARTEQTVAIVDIDDAPELVGALDQLRGLGGPPATPPARGRTATSRCSKRLPSRSGSLSV